MHRTLIAGAVAAACATPAAFAQSAVSIGGALSVTYGTAKATGGTGGSAQDMQSHDRVRDGTDSNIRISVTEDLGGGNSAFVQVESAVLGNADTRNNAFGAGAVSAGWSTKNSAIGIRSKSAGRFLIGVWDLHYNEMDGIDPSRQLTTASTSTLAMSQNFGSAFSINPAIGTRYSNVLRWDSPVWSGFSATLGYARPTDGAPLNAAGDVRDGRKNRAWHLAARYESGNIQVRYAYLHDKDAVTNATISFGGATGAFLGAGTISAAWKITSNRLGVRYRFANGLGAGVIWDSSKVSNTTAVAAASIGIKRDVWAIPITYESGSHYFFAAYARAGDWRGRIGGLGVGAVTNPAIGTQPLGTLNFGSGSGAKFISLGYGYKLSQRSILYVTYQRITNDALARYDTYSNTTDTTAANVGADPSLLQFGMRHTF